MEGTSRITAIEDKASHALRITDCVSNARRSALRDTQQYRRLNRARRFHHTAQVIDPCVQRQVATTPLRHPASPLVITHKSPVRREELQPMPPDRAIPFVLEMRQPVGRLHQQRPPSRIRPRQPCAIGCRHVTNVLASAHACLIASLGTFVAQDSTNFSLNRDNSPIPTPAAILHAFNNTGGFKCSSGCSSLPMVSHAM